MEIVQKKRKKNIGQYITIFFVIFITSMLFAGFLNTAYLEKKAVTEYYEQYNLPDIWMMYRSVSADDLKQIKDSKGVEHAQVRYVYEFSTQNKTQKFATILAMSYKSGDQQSIPYMVKGQLPKNRDEIVLDCEYAKQNKISIGEYILLKLKGKTIQVKVTGYMESVEYPAKIPDSYSDIPDPEIYGIAYLNENTFREEYGTTVEKNQIIVKVNNASQAGQIASKLKERKNSNSFLYSLTRNENAGYNLLTSSYETNKGYAWLSLIIFVPISVLLFISTTKDLWMTYYKRKPIVSILLSIVLMAAGAGSCFGEYIVSKVMIYALEKQVDIGNIEISITCKYILLTVVLMLVLTLIIALVNCRNTYRRDETCYKKFELLENKHIVMKRICLSKAINISIVVGIAVGIAVMMTGVGLYQSVELLQQLQYKQILKADVIVEMNTETIQKNGSMKQTNLLKSPIFSNTLSACYTKIKVRIQNKKNSIVLGDLIAFTSEEDRIKLYGILNEKNQPLQVEQGGVVISKTLSNTFGLKQGDAISFESVDANFEKKVITAQITGVSNQYYSQEIYCTQDFLSKQGFTPCAANRYVKLQNDNVSLNEFQKLLQDNIEVKNVKFVKRIAENMDTYCKDTVYDVYCFGIFGLIIILAVIVSTSNIKYLERRKQIQGRKKDRYGLKKIVEIYTKENIIMCILGAIVGVPLGIAVLQLMLGAHEVGSNMFPVPNYTYNAIGSFVVASIFSWICSYIVWYWILMKKENDYIKNDREEKQ